ncbi:MAG: hypothetical protein IKD69_16395 [Solobacterium sp.]|nr:hypothetical protein [Solobacterium sp.]
MNWWSRRKALLAKMKKDNRNGYFQQPGYPERERKYLTFQYKPAVDFIGYMFPFLLIALVGTFVITVWLSLNHYGDKYLFYWVVASPFTIPLTVFSFLMQCDFLINVSDRGIDVHWHYITQHADWEDVRRIAICYKIRGYVSPSGKDYGLNYHSPDAHLAASIAVTFFLKDAPYEAGLDKLPHVTFDPNHFQLGFFQPDYPRRINAWFTMENMEYIYRNFKGPIADIRQLPSSVINPETNRLYDSRFPQDDPYINGFEQVYGNSYKVRRMVNGQLHTYKYRSGKLMIEICNHQAYKYEYKRHTLIKSYCSRGTGQERKYETDKNNNVIRITVGGKAAAEYTYDENGKLMGQTGELAHINPIKEGCTVTDSGEEIEELMPECFIDGIREEDFFKKEEIIDGIKHIRGYVQDYLLFDQFDGHTEYFKYMPDGTPLYWIRKGRQYYFRFDENGRMAFLIDDSWDVVGRYVYGEYGELIHIDGEAAKDNPLKHIRHEGFNYTWTRWKKEDPAD